MRLILAEFNISCRIRIHQRPQGFGIGQTYPRSRMRLLQELFMRPLLLAMLLASCLVSAAAQGPNTWLADLPQPKDYVQKRASSYDRSGANADSRQIAPGETLTLLDEAGPGMISHIWFTIATEDPHHLKALVLRMYWDSEATPSVETPIGDFFGLGLDDYFLYESLPLSVGSKKALNCYFPMPFQKRAKITVTNEGSI